MKLYDEDIKKYIEQRHNVWVSDDGQAYTTGEKDDVYGWQPLPKEWIEEAEANK